MKKLLFIFCILFLLTGCDVTYNLEIGDDGIKEKTSILDTYEAASLTGELSSNYKLFQVYYAKPIPLSTLAPIQSENNDIVEGVKYYKKTNLSTDDSFGFETYGVFDKDMSISESSILSFGVGKLNFDESEGKIHISIPKNIKVFEQFRDLNTIKVNIKIKNQVVENNADEKKGNIYIWNITRDNYKEKTIDIVYKAKNKISLDDPILRLAILLISIVIFGYIIYFLVKRTYNKKNKL